LADVAETVKVKKRCCKEAPRCKRCPVVWKRLAEQGLATRKGARHYVPASAVRKRDLRAARG
jgi:hypothetical protein